MTSSDSDVAASRADIARPRRATQTFADMGRSLGLMAVVIASVLLLGPARTLVFPGSAERAPVSYSEQSAIFARADSHALLPGGLPKSWRANAATFSPPHGARGARLHIGWATPGSRYIGLDETTGSAGALERQVLGRRGLVPGANVQLSGVTWQHRVSDRGEDSYVATNGPVTVVVTGNATPSQMRDLLSSLRPASTG